METRRIPMLAVVALLVAAAPAAGQLGDIGVGETTVDLSVASPGAPIQPGQVEEHSANVRYQWENGIAQEPTEIRLEVVDEPDWMETTFRPQSFQINNTTQSPAGTELKIITLELDLDRQAPAYQEATATYRIVAEENGVLAGAEAEEEFSLEPAFRGGIDVRFPGGTNVTAWGGLTTSVPVEVTNNANGPVIVESNVVLNPADALIEPPDPFQVNASPDDRTRTVDLEIQVPWKISIDGDAVVSMTPVHMPRGTAAPVYDAEFYLDGRSAIPVPGPGPLVALAAALLASAAAPVLPRG